MPFVLVIHCVIPPSLYGLYNDRYKWGSISHQSVGVVQTLNRNGIDVTVNFPEQANWTGVISEMELVPGSHPRHRYLHVSFFSSSSLFNHVII